MNKKYLFLIVLLILSILIIAVVNKFVINNENINKVSFIATVLENNGNSILVKPEEGSTELNSSELL